MTHVPSAPRYSLRVSAVPLVASIVLLLLGAFGDWPYGYFQFLRFVVCGTAAYAAFAEADSEKHAWLWMMIGVAVLFNPLVPVHLTRETWQPIDVAAAVFFGVFLVVRRRR